MSRLSLQQVLKNNEICCPSCLGALYLNENKKERTIVCGECHKNYEAIEEIPLMLDKADKQSESKKDIQEFWQSLHRTVYQDVERALEREGFSHMMQDLGELFLHRKHLASVEMPVSGLKGKKVLEIGSGTGAHSAFFSSHGAQMYSTDITLDRVIATAKKLDMISDNSSNICLQADAESLPFCSDFFDVVYSNGVLHHTPDTEKAIEEVYRVLKPGGKAAIMLYARDSFYYWVVLFLLKGILMGNVFRGRSWLGHVTEWMSQKSQTVYNLETKVYSRSHILKLFDKFSNVSLRKNSFVFQQIPLAGKIISNLLARKTGLNKAGTILYGFPWRNETRVELWLGRYIGFGLNIEAVK
jgi:ubiquinone/menaquinone biosynthesis C-methylase UbiE/uncharacterized protein YbaR (Trm112 family)